MADIRINALATTAASTASDDFIAVDGSANGTRKLNAYSPTFGGNLTVSGTIYPSGASATLTASGANTIVGSNGATRLQIDHGNGGWGRLQIIPQQTRADISAVLNNATTAQTLGLVGSSVEILTSGGTLAATFNSSQNTTLAGNLTVSGTAINLSTNNSTDKVVSIGYSTVPLYLTSSYDGSTFGLSGFSANSRPSGSSYTTPSNTSYGNLYFLAKIAASDTASAFEWKHAPRTAGTPVTTSLMTLNGSGNLLLKSDGVDSANGKVQLATHTTSAGGIGFGTDTSLYRGASGIGTLELSASSGTVSIFKVALAGTAKAQFGIAAGATYIDYDGSLIVRNGIGGTTALTLDSSQNATFAGNIKTAAPSGGTAATWRLGTVATVSPTSPNRTIEVEIGGTTYYIHAKTTND